MLFIERTNFGALPIWFCAEPVQEGKIDRRTQISYYYDCARGMQVCLFSTLKENNNPCPHSFFIQSPSSTVIWSQTICSLYPFLRKEKTWGQNCRISEHLRTLLGQTQQQSKLTPAFITPEVFFISFSPFFSTSLSFSGYHRQKIWEEMRRLLVWDDGVVNWRWRIPICWCRIRVLVVQQNYQRWTTTTSSKLQNERHHPKVLG